MLSEVLICCAIILCALCYKAIEDTKKETHKNLESLQQEVKDLKNVLNNILAEDDGLILE